MTYTFMDGVKEVLAGNIAPKDDSTRRYDICKNCEFFNRVVLTCGKCGCFMPAKVKLGEATCPAGKW